jgi:hypothetical protein
MYQCKGHELLGVKVMCSDVQKLLNFLEYPSEWNDPDLFPDSLFHIQLKQIIDILGVESFTKKIANDTYGSGSEHYRCGAAWWVFRHTSDSFVLEKLKNALLKDSDARMGRALVKEFNL